MKSGSVSSNQSVMAVDIDLSVVVRNRKHKNLSMKLICSRHGSRVLAGLISPSIKLKNGIDRRTGVANILPVCKIESACTALKILKHGI